MAMNTHRQLGINTNMSQKSIEKLSSGFRINRAGDDAAGLAISEKMRGQIRGLNQASRNAQDGISLIQTAEGALTETHAILQRMRELSVQSATDTNTDLDRGEIQKEIDQLAAEVTRIADTTQFNTMDLLNGGYKDKLFHIGANEQQNTTIAIADMRAEALEVGNAYTATASGINNASGASVGTWYDADAEIVAAGSGGTPPAVTASVAGYYDTSGNLVVESEKLTSGATIIAGIDVSTQLAADNAIATIDTALSTVSSERSKLGAMQNRLEHTIKNLDNTSENLQAAESRIRDVDMAKEMMEFTKQNILQQAATAMLAQANQTPSIVLQLLK